MFYFVRCIAMVGLIFLQSCQHNTEKKEEVPTNKKTKLSDAASYNTQLGYAYLKNGDRSRAKKKLFLALSQDPKSPTVNAAIAFFMEKSGDMVNAQSYYQKALALAPSGGAQLNNYGAFLCRRGEYRQAEVYFQKAINDIQYSNTAAAYENAGLCVLAIPDNVAAAKYFTKALEHDPSRQQSLYELVNLEMKQEHNEKALTYLQKYADFSSNDRALLTLAANVAHKAGKIEIEASYLSRLKTNFSDNTGVKDEYNANYG